MHPDLDKFNPDIGKPELLQPGVRRVLAPNPSPMTYRGTNTYLLGENDICVIDPGPNLPDHLEAIVDALGPGQKVTHIVVTHSHVDHSPLARALADRTGAPVLAFGGPTAGRSAVMADLAKAGLAGGGEGIDMSFEPDKIVQDGDDIVGDDWSLKVIHTPGHLGNHICLAMNRVCFTADHVMGWASSLVSPPDGDLTDFMASCRRLQTTNWKTFHPGHGAPIKSPGQRLNWLVNHRLSREVQIRDALAEESGTAADLARRIYTDTPEALRPAAERNVFAHLVDLFGRGLVRPDGPLGNAATFRCAP